MACLVLLCAVWLGACDRLNHWLTDPEAVPAEAPPAVSFAGGKVSGAGGGAPVSLDTPASCASLAAFRDSALQAADSAERAHLENWHPPEPAGRLQRSGVEKAARSYLERCALPQTVALATQLMAQPTVWDGSPVAQQPAFVASKKVLKDFARLHDLQFSSNPEDTVWQVSLGHGSTNLLLLTHLDVAPAGQGWSSPPFAARVVGHRRLVGRGALDDKGPLAAALIVLKTLAQTGLQPAGKISLLVGTTAEADASPLARYVQGGDRPRRALALDGSFPSSTCELGQATWYLKAPLLPRRHAERLPQVVAAEGGGNPRQVPQAASATLRVAKPVQLADLQRRLKAACERVGAAHRLAASPCTLTLLPQKSSLKVSVVGRLAAAADPQSGINAIVLLAQIVHGLRVAPSGPTALLGAVYAGMTDHVAAPLLGLHYEDPRQGALVVEPTALRTAATSCGLDVSLFRPRGMSNAAFRQRLAGATAALRKSVSPLLGSGGPPSVGDPYESRADPTTVVRLRDILLSVLHRRGLPPLDPDEQQPQLMHRPTLMRSVPQSIGFGPLLPQHPSATHGVDEAIDLLQLQVLLSAYFDAALQFD